MRPPHILMAAAGLAVLGLGVYLFIEVRSAPASPQVAIAKSTPSPTAGPDDPVAPPPADAVPTKPAKPVGDRRGARPPVEPETPPPRTPEEMQKADPNNDSLMDEANRAYDKQEFEEARSIAGRILAKDPNNVRMLRIMVLGGVRRGRQGGGGALARQAPHRGSGGDEDAVHALRRHVPRREVSRRGFVGGRAGRPRGCGLW